MTFSDGNTTIRHRANVCVNHPDREAHNLCVECGQWFCDECMSTTHKYLCNRCAAEVVEAKYEMDRHRDNRSRRNKAASPLVFGGLFLAALLLSRFRIGLIVLPVAVFLLVKQLLGGRREVFSLKAPRKKPTKRFWGVKKEETVTDEQLAVLFRIGGGTVTARKLAHAADVDIKTAKKFLDKKVVEGILDVKAGESELIYVRR
jgi:hypothetical protein